MPSEITKGALAAEADLVTRARRHDEDAVRAIIGQNNRRLFRLARSIVKDDNEAEDIVQECYVRAFAGLGEFRGEARLSTWLTRIVINEAYGRLRRRRPTTDLESIKATHAMDAEIIPFPLALRAPKARNLPTRRSPISPIPRARSISRLRSRL